MAGFGEVGHAQAPEGWVFTLSNIHSLHQLRVNAPSPNSELVHKHTVRRHAAAMEYKPLV